MQILKPAFYINDDVTEIAKNLLGKFLFTKIDNKITGGMIVETESYKGFTDKACHAYLGKKTKRNEAMFEEGGIAYIYVCYGIHFLLNVVTNKKNIPDAVLIRAIEPKVGIETMLKRRKMKVYERSLTAGPGALTKALGITKKINTTPFSSDIIWIEDRNVIINEKDTISSKRVGVEYAKEDANLKWRFRIIKNKWTSLAK